MNVDFNKMFQEQYENNKNDINQFLDSKIYELGLENQKESIVSLVSGLQIMILQQSSIVLQQYHNQITSYIDDRLK